jgi:16S rRNA (cytosine967-C5)-methyltransferase
MTPAARLSAAIEVFAEVEARRRPATDVLKDWGLSHRFAGSSDRAAIAGLVYDSLRRKASSAWLMGGATPRAALIGMLHRERGLDIATISELCSGARFAPATLTEVERAALASNTLANAPAPVAGDYPDWLDPHLARVFGDERTAEGQALATRAPLDLRVNTLKAERDDVLPKFAHLRAEPTRWSPMGLRIRLSADAKNPAIHAEPPFRKGEIEIQDEGSQLAALLAGAKPG